MARKKSNTTIQQYNRLRSQLKRNIRSMEQRGYIFNRPQLPPIPKKITAASVRRLQVIKSNLYVNAQYRTASGEIVGGRYGRSLERQAAGQKAAATRAARSIPTPSNTISAVPVIYNRLQKIIDDITASRPRAGAYLSQLIAKELQFGGDDQEYENQRRIAAQLEAADTKHVEMLCVIAYYRAGTDSAQQAYNELIMILSGGEIPTAEEMAERSQRFHEDENGFLQIDDDSEELDFY